MYLAAEALNHDSYVKLRLHNFSSSCSWRLPCRVVDDCQYSRRPWSSYIEVNKQYKTNTKQWTHCITTNHHTFNPLWCAHTESEGQLHPAVHVSGTRLSNQTMRLRCSQQRWWDVMPYRLVNGYYVLRRSLPSSVVNMAQHPNGHESRQTHIHTKLYS